MASVAPKQGSAKSTLCRLGCGSTGFTVSWSFTTIVCQIRALGKAALHLAGSQDYMRVWSQRSQANSTSGVPWLESCAGEKFRIIHHQIPYLVSYSFDRLRRGSAWLTLRLLRGTSGGQLAQDGNSRAEAADRLRDFEEDIDLALVISDLAGSRERQESRIERDVDAVMLVDKLIPQGEGAAGGEAQPNNGQTNDLRGAGSQFSE
ncbi:FAD binding domain-containing protein [Colletotrichum scovillei]|uniref:FAD binding domain-containing protein n=1 Tax=Colletotrichum scovillei TaxID=1209932 RepID=A0A9P7QWJ8_9PEZI|nr:FAD binding domain-containing protein [Colletotrichum scovillei]KAG7043351.1 FAD binding domain-containing protein [Colletotrichum scovillei]KAG7062798.1 FAD binding domain-containing protein [Colletotrichum scovillei]